MTAAQIIGYITSAAIGALVSFALSSVLLGNRIVKLETQMTHVDGSLKALLGGIGALLREDILANARRESK